MTCELIVIGSDVNGELATGISIVEAKKALDLHGHPAHVHKCAIAFDSWQVTMYGRRVGETCKTMKAAIASASNAMERNASHIPEAIERAKEALEKARLVGTVTV